MRVISVSAVLLGLSIFNVCCESISNEGGERIPSLEEPDPLIIEREVEHPRNFLLAVRTKAESTAVLKTAVAKGTSLPKYGSLRATKATGTKTTPNAKASSVASGNLPKTTIQNTASTLKDSNRHRGVCPAKKPTLNKRTQEAYMEDILVSSRSDPREDMEAVGLNGCPVVYIWADRLYVTHIDPDKIATAMSNLKAAIGRHYTEITDIFIITAAGDAETLDIPEIKDGLEGWDNNVSPQFDTYDASDSQGCYFTTGKYRRKGRVTTQRDTRY